MKKWSPLYWFIHSFQHLLCAGPWVRFRGRQGMDPLRESPLQGETGWSIDIYRAYDHKQRWVLLRGGMVTQSTCASFWWEKGFEEIIWILKCKHFSRPVWSWTTTSNITQECARNAKFSGLLRPTKWNPPAPEGRGRGSPLYFDAHSGLRASGLG